MAEALRSDLLVSRNLTSVELDEILGRSGIMDSATRLGNETDDDCRSSLKLIYKLFAEGSVNNSKEFGC